MDGCHLKGIMWIEKLYKNYYVKASKKICISYINCKKRILGKRRETLYVSSTQSQINVLIVFVLEFIFVKCIDLKPRTSSFYCRTVVRLYNGNFDLFTHLSTNYSTTLSLKFLSCDVIGFKLFDAEDVCRPDI